MAVDTQEKRMNAAVAGRAWLRQKLATGTFDEQARINIGLGYGGNALTPPVGGGGWFVGTITSKPSLAGLATSTPGLDGLAYAGGSND